MRGLLGVLSAVLLAGAGGVVVFSVLNQRQDAYLTPELKRAFDAPEPLSPQQLNPAVSGADPVTYGFRRAALRDAVVSQPQPAGLAYPRRFAPSAYPAARVRRDRLFRRLMSRPARFMIRHTLLGRPDRLEQFLENPRRVDRYLNHPLIRGVLDNPAVLRGFLSWPEVVQGFLGSPAMQNPRAIHALLSSSLFSEIARSRGVQTLLEDPDFIQRALANPETLEWLSRHPQALSALSRLGPLVSQSLGPASNSF